MKKISLSTLALLMVAAEARAQSFSARNKNEQSILALIDKYASARETGDGELLQGILTDDVDQLVSSGMWRSGKDDSMAGMLQSSSNNPGKRILQVENIRFLTSGSAIADARYEIQNADGNMRKMWSTFIVVLENDQWKIAAIRNMLPAR